MKKNLDIEYMRRTLTIKTGVRAGGGNGNGNGKGSDPPVMRYAIQPLYGVEPVPIKLD